MFPLGDMKIQPFNLGVAFAKIVQNMYTSEFTTNQFWFCLIGHLTWDTISFVAAYPMSRRINLGLAWPNLFD